MTFSTGGVSDANKVSLSSDLGSSSTSIQLLFAKLQMELASFNRSKAEGIINEIKESQALAKDYANMINAMRTAKSADDASDSSRATALKDNQSKLKELGVDISSYIKDDEVTADELETVIANLKSKQDTIGTDIQQKMVYVQDYIGQYNSYSSGASTAVSESNDLLKSLATGR